MSLPSSFAGLSGDVLRVFEQYDWPGNVRQLRNVIERSMIVAQGPLINMDAVERYTGVRAAGSGHWDA